jgi:RNA polymerase sigma factor (sigma-70 family)
MITSLAPKSRDSIDSDELSLLRQYQAGDKAAGEVLLARYRKVVYWFARQFAQRTHSTLDRDDLVQVSYIAVMRAMERYDASQGIPPIKYIRHRIRGAMLDVMRRERCRVSSSEAVDESVPDAPVEPAMNAADTEAWWTSALRGLSSLERQVMEQHFRQGLTQAQVCEVVGIGPVRCAQLIRSALDFLRQRDVPV